MASSAACAGFFFDAEPLGATTLPALDVCALCARPLGRDNDIFMYRGDTPFCSEECRHEQMQLDAVRARKAARPAARRQQHYTSGADTPRGHHKGSWKVSVAS
ncbi:hypothetical protein GQ55_7G260700 [Panicum hallii var. hallii]|uniref:FLZ-type domain-containing protein n=1 Tax=Panicum hallii var. hallii TaxID=1504633 RepID=A0A2T7CZG2_9POAL|nr:hypothetical protein GQ55_7G260700 [Panicum hallii var. hallii]